MGDVQHDELVDALGDLVEGHQTEHTHGHVQGQGEDDADADDGVDTLGMLHGHLGMNRANNQYIGRGNQTVDSQTEAEETETFADLNFAVSMPEVIAPSKTVVNRTVTTMKRIENAYMMITIQHNTMTITEPREAKEIERRLLRRQRGISINK